MELDELKAIWQAHDQQIQATQHLNNQVLRMFLRDRSLNVIDKMIRETRRAGLLLAAVVLFLIATVVGNAFDCPHPLYHLPAIGFSTVATFGLYLLIKHHRELHRVTIYGQDTHQALSDLIQLRLRFTGIMNRVWGLIMMAAMLINLSLVARRFTDGDLLNTLLVTLIPVGITALAFSIARWAGAFTDRYAEQLTEHLRELEALRSPAESAE